jgi:hypothetical protein
MKRPVISCYDESVCVVVSFRCPGCVLRVGCVAVSAVAAAVFPTRAEISNASEVDINSFVKFRTISCANQRRTRNSGIMSYSKSGYYNDTVSGAHIGVYGVSQRQVGSKWAPNFGRDSRRCPATSLETSSEPWFIRVILHLKQYQGSTQRQRMKCPGRRTSHRFHFSNAGKLGYPVGR